MGNLLNPLWRKKGEASGATTAADALASSAPVGEASSSPLGPSEHKTVEQKPLEPVEEEEPPRDVATIEVPQPIRDALAACVAEGAHALLLDPEEFECQLCRISSGSIEVIGECPLDDYHLAHRALQLLDHERIVVGDCTVRVQLFTSVTDLGRRNVLQLFDLSWDAETVTERRKGNVRAINRLRPGTSLTRHNRKRMLATLEAAGERPPPDFRQRLLDAGIIDDDAPDDLASLIQTSVMPRKAASRILGEYLGIPFVDVEESVPRTHGPLLEQAEIVQWEAIPVGEEDDAVLVAMADPTDAAALEAIKARLERPVILRVAAATDIRVAAEKIFRSR